MNTYENSLILGAAHVMSNMSLLSSCGIKKKDKKKIHGKVKTKKKTLTIEKTVSS